MFKKIQYGIALLGLPLYLICMSAHASYGNCRTSTKIVKGDIVAPLCDISFTGVPSFSCVAPFPQMGVFTLRNNTPVTMIIGPATIITQDGGATTGTAITANTCGSSLAPGASCTITVTLASAPFNRVLRIGVNSRQVELDSPVITPTVNCVLPPAQVSTALTNACPGGLGTASTYGVLAGSAITNTGPTVINGDLGLSPLTSVTGFPPGTVTGSQHVADSAAATAQVDATTLYNCLALLPCDVNIDDPYDLANKTLIAPNVGGINVYCSTSTIQNSGGVLTLSGGGNANTVFIFKAGSALTMNPGSSIVLTGNAKAANVFWQLGSSATLKSTVMFQGTIVALTSISLQNGATILGRALARNGAVTFINNFVTVP